MYVCMYVRYELNNYKILSNGQMVTLFAFVFTPNPPVHSVTVTSNVKKLIKYGTQRVKNKSV